MIFQFTKSSSLEDVMTNIKFQGKNPSCHYIPDVNLFVLVSDALTSLTVLFASLQELKHNATALLSDAIYDDPWTNALTDCLCVRDYVRVSKLAKKIIS
jgi:hypothetical protein